MANDRRHFLRGGWLRAAETAPAPPGASEIASLVVHTRPEHLPDVRSAIEAMPCTAIAAEDPRGKLIVLVETGPGDRLGDTLTALSVAPKVISAVLVYHAVADKEIA